MTRKVGLQPFIGLTFIFFALFPLVLAWMPGGWWLAIAFVVYGLREIGVTCSSPCTWINPTGDLAVFPGLVTAMMSALGAFLNIFSGSVTVGHAHDHSRRRL